ncbi:MAG: histone deacetylase family protein [Parvularculaceae bacterium]
MTTLLISQPDCQLHDPISGHVEQPARYGAVAAALATEGFGFLERSIAPLGQWHQVGLAHPEEQMGWIKQRELARQEEIDGVMALDPDTFLGPGSLNAALYGVGAGVAGVDAVMAGEADNAFCLVRPPGHHAELNRAMGFCVFNSAAIAARHARVAHGCERIAVVDFDVHHGNGTQNILWEDEAGFFASSHEWPQYPGTGKASDRGLYGTIYNQPLETGSGSHLFQRAWGQELLPALQDFGPDFIIISAGFDGHIADPLGGLALRETDFYWVTEAIRQVAQDTCQGRIVSLLEGGYDLGALGKSASAHVKALARLPEIG